MPTRLYSCGWACRSLKNVLLATTLILSTLAVSCREDTRPLMAEFDAPAGPSMSLRETFDFLLAANERRAFLALRPYIEPVQRDEVVDLLLAVDAFTIANAAALQAVGRACPGFPRERLDISVLADMLEFSPRVQVVSEQEDRNKGEGAIAVRIAGQPEPQKVHFRLLDGRWVYVPGPHIDGLIGTFRALTKALERINRAIACSSEMTPEQIESQYKLFVVPTIKRVSGRLTAR
jgi:hypothetical protein